MLKTLLSTLALTTLLSSAAWAGPAAPTTAIPIDLQRPESTRVASATQSGPVQLTEAQLDAITAGAGAGGGGGWLDRSIISSQGAKGGMGTEEDG